MMRPIRALLAPFLGVALGALLGLAAGVAPARAAGEMPPIPAQKWSFSGPFGAFDLASAQRGLQVYKEVCSNCHSMRQLSYRSLAGLGLNDAQIRAFAAQFTVPLGLNDQGEMVEGPALPSSRFRSPFPNDAAARSANNGALPPDLSVIEKARHGGADYIFALLTGYADPPDDMQLQPGMMYNKFYPGHQIGMPPPLIEGIVTYTDGKQATTEQMAHDVVTFLTWAANPEMVERKQMGVRVVLFLVLMTGLTYAVKRQVWADVH